MGANLARRLLSDGHEVHLLLRPGYSSWRLEKIRRDLELHEEQLSNRDGVQALIQGIQPEWIFHLAVYGAYSSQCDVPSMVQTNIVSTVNLIDACVETGFQAFVNTGSSSEYGLKDHAPAETEWLDPNSAYAVTKAAATLYGRHVARSRDVNISTLRLYSVYGAYEEPARMVPTLVIRGLRSQLPPLANPDIARDYVYIDDVMDAYVLSAMQTEREPGAVYNVGTGTQTSLREVVDTARQVMNIRAEPEWGTFPDRAWDTSTWIADNTKIRHELGWQPAYTFQTGLRATVQWFRDNTVLRQEYEERLMPPSGNR